MNDLTKKMKTQGEIFETDFDMCDIMSSHQDNSKKARDELVIYRRRSCILTHPGLFHLRECEKLQKKKKTDDTAEAAEKREEKKREAVEKATKKAEASKTAKKPRAK